MRRAAPVAAALLLAACGGGGGGSSTSTATGPGEAHAPARTVTRPPPAAPATIPARPARPAPAKPGTGGAPEQQPGGGGDEQGNRIPVALRVGAGGTVRPRVVRVPAFFRLAVRIANRDRRAHRLVLAGGTLRHEVENLPAGGAIAFGLRPRRPTTYRVLVDRRVRGHIITGVQPGP